MQATFSVIRNVPEYINIAPQQKEKILIYQGSIRAERGLPQLIETMQHVNAKLIIAGGGTLLNELKNLTSTLNLSHKIEFTGFQTPQQLREITEKAYIGISPLEPKGFNHLYSLSNKFLEYIQLEIPQIAMNFKEYNLINQQHKVAILINDVTPPYFADAINQLLSDDEMYQQLKQNTQKAKKELHWGNEKVKLIHFYRAIFKP
jgi:glycosyltransferase involved in cell wall biosynthesis